MKNFKHAVAVASVVATSALCSTQVLAEDEFSANAALTSNYLWRGVSQTGGSAAVSGGVDYTSSGSGFYAGTWMSNAGGSGNMSYELDLYGGFTNDINESMSYDVGYIYYAYPDAVNGMGEDADLGFSEIYGSFSFNAFTVGASLLASADGADFGDSLYISGEYALPVTDETELVFHIGSYSGDWLGDNEYIDFGVSISKSGFSFGTSLTDLDGNAGDLKMYISYGMDIDL